MEILKGSIVKARAGRDKDDFFVVLKVEDDYAFIANGKRRKVENPKKKKLKHLAGTTKIIDLGDVVTNKFIKKSLSLVLESGSD